ncbi:hypothetical protein KI387_012813, partial [Taxus chinensis]
AKYFRASGRQHNGRAIASLASFLGKPRSFSVSCANEISNFTSSSSSGNAPV